MHIQNIILQILKRDFSLKYRAEIDGLRTVAIVPVILFHAGFEKFSGGFVGVDIFFVISGYLITTILIDDMENKRFSFTNFYERRARRILPALFAVLFFSAAAGYFLLYPTNYEDFSRSLFSVVLFYSNIFFWQRTDYFTTEAELTPLLHTWSLAVEEQYYFLFPIFIYLVWRFGKNRIFWIIVVMAIFSLLLSEWGWRNKATPNFYLLPTRAWELFAGSIAAFIISKHGVQKNNLLALLGLAAIMFSIFTYDKNTPFPSIYALVPVFGAVLLVLFADKDTLVARILSIKVFVGIGLISYSAYLWHQPLFAFYRYSHGINLSILSAFTLIVLSLFLAAISWKFIEQPFRDKNKLSRKMLFIILSFSGLLLLLISYAIDKTSGAKHRFEFPAKPTPWSDIKCHGAKRLAKYDDPLVECLGSGNNVKGDIYLIGDSHAAQITFALDAIAKKRGVSFYFINTGLRSGDYPHSFLDGTVKNDRLLDHVLDVADEGDIFITAFHRGRMNPIRDWHFSKEILNRFRKRQILFRNNIESYIEKFQTKGIDVYFVKDGPLLNNFVTSLEACMHKFQKEKVPSCKIAFDVDNTTRLLQSELFDEFALKHSNVTTIDYLPELYTDGFFSPISPEGEYLMFDKHHLTKATSLSLIDYFEKNIKVKSSGD